MDHKGEFERKVTFVFKGDLLHWELQMICKEGSGTGNFSPYSHTMENAGASYFERQFKNSYGNGASLSLWELCEGSLEGGLLYWGP